MRSAPPRSNPRTLGSCTGTFIPTLSISIANPTSLRNDSVGLPVHTEAGAANDDAGEDLPDDRRNRAAAGRRHERTA